MRKQKPSDPATIRKSLLRRSAVWLGIGAVSGLVTIGAMFEGHHSKTAKNMVIPGAAVMLIAFRRAEANARKSATVDVLYPILRN
jgi:hypothetical protein